MNKKQLISIIRTEVLLAKSSPERKGYIAGLEEAISIIEGFSDEPQKTVVPQFVADLIEYAKDHDWDLEDTFQDIAGEADDSNIYQWYYTKSENMDTFARAWLDGYEVEKEKRYLVKVKGMGEDFNFLNFNTMLERWSLFDSKGYNDYRTHHTRKELENGGFLWVFDCPGIEIEEAE